jgi:hypothetical protein
MSTLAPRLPKNGMLTELRAKLSMLTTEELFAKWERGLRMIVESWVEQALIVDILLERGETERTEAIRKQTRGPMLTWMRRIADGTYCAEAICKFYRPADMSLLRRILKLPADDQVRLAVGGTVELVVPDGHGGRTHRNALPEEMTPEQIKQVFAGDHIRTKAEQNLYLDNESREAAMPVSERIGPGRIDKVQKCVFVGSRRFDLATLKLWVKAIEK